MNDELILLLRELYDAVLVEPIPADMLALLERLDDVE